VPVIFIYTLFQRVVVHTPFCYNMDMEPLSYREIVRVEVLARILQDKIENPRRSIREICQDRNVPIDVFYRWVANDSKAMSIVRDSLSAAQRNALLDFSDSLYNAIRLLIRDATNSELPTETRIQALKFLVPLMDNLASTYQAQPVDTNAADFLRKGVEIAPAKSRFHSVEVSVDEDGVRIEVSKERDPIDVEALPPLDEEDSQESQ